MDALPKESPLELVYSRQSKLTADLFRLLAVFLGIEDAAIAFTALAPESEKSFINSLKTGPYLPVLFDNEALLEISQPLAILQHLVDAAKAPRTPLVAGDKVRCSLAVEQVFRFFRENSTTPPVPAPGESVDVAMRRRIVMQLRMLAAVLIQRPLSERDVGADEESGMQRVRLTVTVGDLAAWLFTDVVCKVYGAPLLDEVAPVLSQLHKALAGHVAVQAFLRSRTQGAAGGVASRSGGSKVSAPGGDAAPAAIATATAAVAAPADASVSAPAAAAVSTPRAPAPVVASVSTAAPVPVSVVAAPSLPASPQPPVAVTGANGYIASWIVKMLLDSGATVHATVRSLGPSAAGRYAHLQALPGAAERLRLFAVDLLDADAEAAEPAAAAAGAAATPPLTGFDAAFAGCVGVYHCASPFFFAPKKDAHEELIRPAVEGTRKALAAAARCPSVRRVVMTSSVAAIYVGTLPADHWYTEEDWSDLEHVRATKQHYAESKCLAEREAWRWMREELPAARSSSRGQQPMDLITVCPTQTIGPLLQPNMNTSCASILELLDGSKALLPNKSKCFCDVRDVAEAHLRAMQTPAASGRYMVISASIAWRDVAAILRSALPGARVPAAVEAGPPSYPQALASHRRLHELGVHLTPVEDSLRDCALSLFAKGFLDDVIPPAVDPRQPREEEVAAAEGGAAAARA